MAMIAAVAFLAVPACLYMANPEFTCAETEPEQDTNYHSDEEEEADKKILSSDSQDHKQGPDDKEDRQSPLKMDATQFHRERLIKAAEDLFGPAEAKNTNNDSKTNLVPRKREETPKRNISPPSSPIANRQIFAATPSTPLATTSTTPVPILPKEESDVTPKRRESSAYKIRLSHLEQQQAIFKQHKEVIQNARSVSPQKHINRESEKREDAPMPARPVPAPLSAPVPAPATAPAPVAAAKRATPPKSRESAVRSISPATLPPLPPKKRDEPIVSPVRTSAKPPTLPLSGVTSASSSLLNAEPYLTPRAKQQKALAELRRQEEEQRNLAKVVIQEELARALDDLRAEEALQKERDELERQALVEEQRRRETVQQTLMEEKQRILKEEEQRREERKRLQLAQRSQEEEQRLADQRAMADLLIEVENERVAEEKRKQEEQMARVQRLLKSEEQRQHEILEQLRLQNQYPYPRGHSSAILTALAGGSNPNASPTDRSPAHSPNITPNGSMRLPRAPLPAGVVRESSHDSDSAGPVPIEDSPSTPPRQVSPSKNRLSSGSATSKSSAIPVRTSSSNKLDEVARLRAEQHRLVEQRIEERRLSAQRAEEHVVEQYHEHKEYDTEIHEGNKHTLVHTSSDVTRSVEVHKVSTSSKGAVSPTVESSPVHHQSSPRSPAQTTPVQNARSSSRPNSRPVSRSNSAARLRPDRSAPPSPQTPSAGGGGEDVEESTEVRVLHARDELAMRIETYIRSQKKFSSAAPLKYKCPVSKIVTDCEKYRKAFNQIAKEEEFKVHSLLQFMEHSPRFNVSGGHQMVGVTHLTPFQSSDTRRVYGHFKCSKCVKYWMEAGVNKSDFREWQNAYSYKDCFQTCYQCNVQVYPYIQRALKKTELHFDDRLKHDVSRCSRCEHLHRPCYEFEV